MITTDNAYGNGERSPYSLYQAPNGKWGLVDGTGAKLDAVFDRLDETRFSRVPWEVVAFDEKEGFSLLAWFDPDEAWFAFTWGDPAYPDEFADLLWLDSKNEIERYKDSIYGLIPADNHWLVDCIFDVRNLDQMEDDDERNKQIEAMLSNHPEIADASITNPMLDLVMRNHRVDKDVKVALWHTKVRLDDLIREYKEDCAEGL